MIPYPPGLGYVNEATKALSPPDTSIHPVCRIPLLIVKANSVGTATQPHNPAPSLRAMLDLQSTSRHSLEYLLGRLQTHRGDSVVLAVSRALDTDDQVRSAGGT
jgi:hypothetical protein